MSVWWHGFQQENVDACVFSSNLSDHSKHSSNKPRTRSISSSSLGSLPPGLPPTAADTVSAPAAGKPGYSSTASSAVDNTTLRALRYARRSGSLVSLNPAANQPERRARPSRSHSSSGVPAANDRQKVPHKKSDRKSSESSTAASSRKRHRSSTQKSTASVVGGKGDKKLESSAAVATTSASSVAVPLLDPPPTKRSRVTKRTCSHSLPENQPSAPEIASKSRASTAAGTKSTRASVAEHHSTAATAAGKKKTKTRETTSLLAALVADTVVEKGGPLASKKQKRSRTASATVATATQDSAAPSTSRAEGTERQSEDCGTGAGARLRRGTRRTSTETAGQQRNADAPSNTSGRPAETTGSCASSKYVDLC